MNYDGFSRHELSKILAEPTDVEPRKTRYYAVAIGHQRGIYYDWPSAEKQVRGYVGAKHKKFKTEEEAIDYCTKHSEPTQFAIKPAERSFDSGNRSNEISYDPLPLSSQQKHSLDLNRNFVPLSEGPVDDGPHLVPEQQHVVDLILQGHNVFYTGSAGCGKSTILKAFVKRLQQQGKRVKIVAPTNLAALNIGGQTTWSFAGWTPDSMKTRIDKLMEKSRGEKSWKKFDETDVLVIDEISMIENLMFERLNMILKASRGEKYGGGAFGGVQLVVTGDVSRFMAEFVVMANQHSSISLPPLSHSVTACAAGN
jgi:ATP-dependent DNA helicase PIF1